jgi:hypothetical protein
MLDRIEMHIIGAAFEISFITYGILPKALFAKENIRRDDRGKLERP